MAEDLHDILLVDSDAALAGTLEKRLTSLGHQVTIAATAGRAIERIKETPPVLTIVAAREQPPGAESLEFLKHLDSRGLPFLLTAATAAHVQPFVSAQPAAVALEPFREGELELALALAQDRIARRRKSEDHTTILHSVVDGLLDSVFVIDAERNVVFCNATVRRQLQEDALVGKPLQQFFPPGEAGNESLLATVNSALTGSGAIGSGSRATLQSRPGQTLPVVVIVQDFKDASGAVTGVSISFRPAAQAPPEPSRPTDEGPGVENADPAEAADPVQPVPIQNTPLRAKAIRSIEAGLNSDSPTHKHYVVVLLLSQFDMFRLRYGLNNAEKLVHAFSAHLIKSLPPEDRLYTWSNRTVVVLLERESAIDEVRLEMTAFCSRRVDYYLNATGRSALVTLSASWHLIPLFDSPDAKRDPRRIIDQIDAFERMHTRRK